MQHHLTTNNDTEFLEPNNSNRTHNDELLIEYRVTHDPIHSYSNIKMSALSSILAVGLEIDTANLIATLEQNEIEVPQELRDTPKVYSGVLFCKVMCQYHKHQYTNLTHTDQKGLMTWFSKFKQVCAQDNRAFTKRLHLSLNGHLIVGEVYVGTTRFFVFFYNKKNIGTTLIKKEISDIGSNHYATHYRCVDIDRIEMECRPYLHYLTQDKRTKLFFDYPQKE